MTKKQKIEVCARDLFMKYGFRKITIDEVCKKAHVSRKTFYTYFENKTALVIEILAQWSEDAFANYQLILNGNETFAEKLEKSILMKYEVSKTFSKEFVADLFEPTALEILTFWSGTVQKSMGLVMDFFRDAQRTGDMNPELDLKFVMWMMQKMLDLMKTEELLNFYESPEVLTRQMTQMLIYGIMPPPSSTSFIKE